MGFVHASISITRSQFALMAYFSFGPVKKIIRTYYTKIQSSTNRQLAISDILSRLMQENPVLSLLYWNISIDGSGILVRILDVESSPGTPIENSILWTIKKNLPFALTSSHYNYKILEKSGTKYRVLAAISKKEFLDSFTELLEKSGIDVWQIRIGSLQLASQPSPSNYHFLYQGEDFSFAAIVESKKLKQYHVIHDATPEKGWESLQKFWTNITDTTKLKPVIFKSVTDKSLRWLSSSATKEYSAPAPYSGSLPDNVRYELSANSAYVSFSPELLPEIKRNKADRSRIAYRILALFLGLQLFTPFFYYTIKKQKSFLLGETSYSLLQTKINQLQKDKEEIRGIQEQIIFASNKIKTSSAGFSEILGKIASFMPQGMTLTRLKVTKKGILLEGYALDLEVLSDFLTQFEEELGKPSYETKRKGSAIEYKIRWKGKKPV